MRAGMRSHRRKITPGVKDGRVRKKHRWELTPTDDYARTPSLQIVRRAPGPGSIHVVDEGDIVRFIRLLHDWPEVSRGLRSIVLEADEENCLGWSRPDGVIALNAWPRDLVQDLDTDYYREHEDVFSRIGIPCESIEKGGELVDDDPDDDPGVRCWFDRATARAFVLLHVFLHELGHHVDRISTQTCGPAPRGEEFAEAWALERELLLWPLYKEHFGRPGRG